MDREGVTVCITAYKSKDYIKECLEINSNSGIIVMKIILYMVVIK